MLSESKSLAHSHHFVINHLVNLAAAAILILLLPLLLINKIDHNSNVRKSNPFYKSKLVRLIEKYPLIYNISIAIWNFPLYSKIYDLLPDVSGNLLQVGCGTGLLNKYLRKKGMLNAKMINLDLNLNYLRYALKKGTFPSCLTASIYNVPIKDDYFDVIIFARCFHHIMHHQKAFAECARLLKKNGIIIITDPARLPLKEKATSYTSNTDIDGLIWIFNASSLKEHIETHLVPELKIRSVKFVRQLHATNYNPIYPHTDCLLIIEKGL